MIQKPHVPWICSSTYSKDLIALSSEPNALKEIFSDRLYVALRDPSKAASLSELARTLALPTVVTHPSIILSPEQATLQRTLTAIRLNQTMQYNLPDDAVAPSNAYFMSSQEMETRFKEFPEALAATMEIAERCKFDLPIGRNLKCPLFLCLLESLQHNTCEIKPQKVRRHLYGEITPVIQARLDHELEVIATDGLRTDLPDRGRHHGFCQTNWSSILFTRLSSFLTCGALSGDHQPGPTAIEFIFRTLPESSPHHAARYRYRPVFAPQGLRSSSMSLTHTDRIVSQWSGRSTATVRARHWVM